MAVELWDWWVGCCAVLGEWACRALMGRPPGPRTRAELEAEHRARLAASERWLRDAQRRYAAIMELPSPLEDFLAALNPPEAVVTPVPLRAAESHLDTTPLVEALSGWGISAQEAAAAMRQMAAAMNAVGRISLRSP